MSVDLLINYGSKWLTQNFQGFYYGLARIATIFRVDIEQPKRGETQKQETAVAEGD